MLGGPLERSGFPPPAGSFTPPRCGLFLLRRSQEGIPREISLVLAAVFGALKESGTTKANVANELDLYAADVNALIFGLSAITAAPSGGRRRRDTVDSLEKRNQFRIV